MKEAFIYSCRYKNIYSCIVVAADQYSALRIFKEWMLDAHGQMNPDASKIVVRRTFKSDKRPIYIA